ncbi:MAG: hypothetical protein R3180_00285 [Marinobacter sp.]|nr:hypothetical protein [Marinobacter sp.]
MRNRYRRDLNRLVIHPRPGQNARGLRNPGGLNGIFSAAAGVPQEPLIVALPEAFAAIPQTDDAPSGWGLPDTGGLGTVGGTDPWVKLATSDYGLTRFVPAQSHGNIYYMPTDTSLPVLSWVGPQNGYLYQAGAFNASSKTTPGQNSFQRDLYAFGKKIGQVPSNYQIAGASIIALSGGGYRLTLGVQYNYGDLSLMTADVADLSFDTLITTWTETLPPTNPDVSGGYYRTDGKVAFNGSGTTCAFVWGLGVYEWNVVTNTIIVRDDLSQTLPDDNPPKASCTVISTTSNNAATNPCGGTDPWPTELQVSESLNRDWSSTTNQSYRPAVVDYDGDTLISLDLWTKGTGEEVFSYTSDRTHTRPSDVCAPSWGTAAETLSFAGYFKSSYGQYYSIGATSLTKTDYSESNFSGGPGTDRSYAGPGFEVQAADDYVSSTVGAADSVDSFVDIRRDTYIRFVDIRAKALVYTVAETESTGVDTDGMKLWTQTIRWIFSLNGVETEFLTFDFGTHRESDILVGGSVEVKNPTLGSISIWGVSSRDGTKFFASIFESSASYINYLTGADPVAITGITGANPRFDSITLVN